MPVLEHQKPVPKRVANRAALNYSVNESGCFISQYSVNSSGYAQIGWIENGIRSGTTAHRAAWVFHTGEQIPQGMTIDHLCKNRRCVNPMHLRLLENFENARRTNGRDWPLGQCANGHPNSEIYWSSGRRRCRICARQSKKRYESRNKKKVADSKRRYAQRIRSLNRMK